MLRQLLHRPLIETAELAQLIKTRPTHLTIINTNFGYDYDTHAIKPASEWDKVYKNERIPGARHLNIGAIGDKTDNLPNMLPHIENYFNLMRDLDIGLNDYVVCYGDENIVGPSRAWWMFKVFGFPNISILNGTFKKWKSEGHPVETGLERWRGTIRDRKREDFMFHYDGFIVSTLDDMQSHAKRGVAGTINILDARNSERFTGEEKDTKGLRSGHIPGAKNIPSTDFLNMPENTFKSPEEIEKILEAASISINSPIRTYCGSGMVSSVVYFACHLAGADNLALYDGSWSEWVQHPECPVAVTKGEEATASKSQ